MSVTDTTEPAGPGGVAIEVSEVSKTYGDVRALKDVSLAFEWGGVHGLIGPNGSGKTTLFRILLGLTRPSGGALSMPAATLGCGFQEPQFYPDLTVAENLSVFRSLTGANREWVEELTDTCGLSPIAERRAGDLSDGQAKTLDFALAFVEEPDVVFLDEPFADIDDEAKPRLLEFLEAYCTGERLVLVSTHQLSLFESVLDSLTVLHRGEVALADPLETAPSDRDRDLMETYLDQIE